MGEIRKFEPRPVSDAAAGTTRFVRVTGTNPRGFVEFQFSVDDPTLYLEMTLPPAAFEEFCRAQGARHLSESEAERVDESEARWRFGAE